MQIFDDEVETELWESEAKWGILFAWRIGYRKLLRKWFWSYLKLKSECYECYFWVIKLRPLSGKARQSLQDHLNLKLIIGNFLENSFETISSSKTNVLSVWKGLFSVFCRFLIDEVQTIFWESQAKHQILFKSKFGHRKLLRKRSWSHLELKNECSERLKRAFFSFLQVFGWRSWNRFQGKQDNLLETFCIKSALFGAFWKNVFQFLFDHSRQSLLQFLNILNVWNVSIWIFNWIVVL